MKAIYCANCGRKLPVFRKALGPAYGRILDLVEPHVCSDEPEEFDLTPIDLPTTSMSEDNKFVRKLDELPRVPGQGDLRPKEHQREEKKTSAPDSLLNVMGSVPHSTPEGDISNEPDEA